MASTDKVFYTNTPSPRLTWFRVTRNSTSAEFLKTALCGIPLQWNSSKPRYAEFQRNSTTVPLTQFSRNAEFRNARQAGTRCTLIAYNYLSALEGRHVDPQMVDELATIVVVLLPSPIKKHGCAEPFRELRATSSSPKQTLLDLFCIVNVVCN